MKKTIEAAIKKAIEAIPAEERRRMLWVMVSDLEAVTEDWDAIFMLEELTGMDFFDNYDPSWANDEWSQASKDGYLKLGHEIIKYFGISFSSPMIEDDSVYYGELVNEEMVKLRGELSRYESRLKVEGKTPEEVTAAERAVWTGFAGLLQEGKPIHEARVGACELMGETK